MPVIRPARWPHDAEDARVLLRHYLHFLQNNPAGPVDVCMAGYEKELKDLESLYVEPHSVLLMAFQDGEALGCVAVKQRSDRPGECEMKRLWTELSARGTGMGKALTEAAKAWAVEHGSHTLLLDTVADAMPDAVRLYRSLGFVETVRHNANPLPGLVFMKADLR